MFARILLQNNARRLISKTTTKIILPNRFHTSNILRNVVNCNFKISEKLQQSLNNRADCINNEIKCKKYEELNKITQSAISQVKILEAENIELLAKISKLNGDRKQQNEAKTPVSASPAVDNNITFMRAWRYAMGITATLFMLIWLLLELNHSEFMEKNSYLYVIEAFLIISFMFAIMLIS